MDDKSKNILQGQFSASFKLSQNQMSLFDDLNITLELMYPNTYHPDLKLIQMHLFQYFGIGDLPFTLKSEQAFPPENRNGLLHQKIIYTLIPQKPGSYNLSFFDIPFEPNSQSNKKVVILSGIEKITVTLSQSSLPQIDDEPQLMTFSPKLPIDLSPKNRAQWLLAPEKKAEEFSYNQKKFEDRSIPWMKILLIFALIPFSLVIKNWGVMKKLRQLKTVSPLAKALNALENLQRDVLLTKKNISDHYATLTKILRDFLEDYYHIKAKAHSTEELLVDPLFQRTFEKDKKLLLQKIFLKADAIEFGYQPISTQECTEDINSIKEILLTIEKK